MQKLLNLGLLFSFMFLAVNWGSAQTKPFSKGKIYKMADLEFLKHQLKTNKQVPDLSETPSEKSSLKEGNVSKTEEAESEIHAAVNPLDSNNMIVATMQVTTTNTNPLFASSEVDIIIYTTKDGGKTWRLNQFNPMGSTPINIVNGGGDPIVVFDHEGKAHLSFLRIEFVLLQLKFVAKMGYAVSSDGGITWMPKNDIDEVAFVSFTDPSRKILDKEWMAADQHSSNNKGSVYCAYTEINIQDTTYNLYVKRKLPKADAFETTRIPVTKSNFAFAHFSSLEVDRKGVVHLAFVGAKPEDDVLSLFYCNSQDGGKSFSTPKKLIEVTVPCFPAEQQSKCSVVGFEDRLLYHCPIIAVDKSGKSTDGNIYLSWTGLDNYNLNSSRNPRSGMDVFLLRSTDGGKNWSSPYKLNRDANGNNDQFYSSLYVSPKGALIATWYDRREDKDNKLGRYYFTTSCDGGKTFTTEIPLSSEPMDFSQIGKKNGGFGIGEYTQVVATNSTAFPFWADGRSNNGNLEVMTSPITLNCAQTVAIRRIQTLTNDLIVNKIYPNPTKDIVSVDLESAKSGDIELHIFALDGKLIQSTKIQRFAIGKQEVNLSLSGVPSGQYWLVVKQGVNKVVEVVSKL